MIPRSLLFQPNKSIDAEIYCSVCKNIPLNPLQCSGMSCNQYLFCYSCLECGACPHCKSQCNLKKLSGQLRPRIKGLQFYCPNNKLGCQEIIEYEYYLTHIKNCKYSKNAPPLDPSTYSLTSRRKRSSSFSMTSCHICGFKYSEGDKGSHDCKLALRQEIEEMRRVINSVKSDEFKKRMEECLSDVGGLKGRVRSLEMQVSALQGKKIEVSPDLDTAATSKSTEENAYSKSSTIQKELKGIEQRPSSPKAKKCTKPMCKNKNVKSQMTYSNNNGGLICGSLSNGGFISTCQAKVPIGTNDKLLCSYNLGEGMSVFGDSCGNLSFYNTLENKVSLIKAHSKAITSIIEKYSSNEIISSSIDKTIAIYDLDRKSIKKTHKVGRSLLNFEILDSKSMLCSSDDKYLYSLDTDTGMLQTQYGPFNEMLIDILSIGGTKYMLSCMDKNIYIYDCEKAKIINHWNADLQLLVPSEHLLHVEPNIFACPNSLYSINLWDIDGRKIGQLKGHTGNIRKIMSHKNKFISCGEDGRMINWSTQGKMYSFSDPQGISTFC